MPGQPVVRNPTGSHTLLYSEVCRVARRQSRPGQPTADSVVGLFTSNCKTKLSHYLSR